ncbi:MAG: endonuclease [Pseudonocardiales bacterium]|nr:endonuclease [Pseudonocardiales bacterium]
MPEGDTVYLTAQRLRTALEGRPVTQFDLRIPSLALTNQVGTTVREVVPVGKHILMRFSDGRTLHSHLRMDGAWRVNPAGQRPRGGPGHAIRAVVANADSVAVGYRVHDLSLIDTACESEVVGHLGPDLLAAQFDVAESIHRFTAQPDRLIGDALLDQRLVAGIGNVYKCELLFLHRLNPWQTIAGTTDLEAVLIDAARLLKGNIGRFNRSTTGWTQPAQQYYVYGRTGRGCRRCGTAIRQDAQGDPSMQRVLYYCPSCQAGTSSAAPHSG